MRKEIAYYTKVAFEFQRYLRSKPIADPSRHLRAALQNREQTFLDLVKPAIFDNPATPLHHLLKHAQCEFGDLADSVKRKGLESLLKDLRAAGVYLTSEETKGRQNVIRHGKEIPNSPLACRNPLAHGGTPGSSSGSRGPAATSQIPLPWRLHRDCYDAVMRRDLAYGNCTEVALNSILPAVWSLNQAALAFRTGSSVARWFAPGGTWKDNGHYRLATRLLVAEARLLGYKVPYPEFLPSNDFSPVIQFLARCRTAGKPAVARGTVSTVTRICSDARDAGADISGTLFNVGGEALTDSRRELVHAAGCRAVSRYITNETGPVGLGCRHMTGSNTVHFFADSHALIVVKRPAPLTDHEVDSLHFTTLNPHAYRVFLNAEIDDSARLIPANCDCEFSRIGFTTALTDIHSFGKLTGFGMTLVGTNLLPILEQHLPKTFGGSAADYQLVESSANNTQMELTLRVNPRLKANLDDVRVFFLDQVQGVYGGALTRRTWEHAGALRVAAIPPLATRTGKILSLHLASFHDSN